MTYSSRDLTSWMRLENKIFKKKKPIDWSNEKCVICYLKLAVNLQEVCQKTKKITTWYNFTVQKGTV